MLAKVRSWHMKRSTDKYKRLLKLLCARSTRLCSQTGDPSGLPSGSHTFLATLSAVKSESLPTWSDGGLRLQSLHGILIQSFTRALEDDIQRALWGWGPFLQTWSRGVRNSSLCVRISAVFLMILAICDCCHLVLQQLQAILHHRHGKASFHWGL